MVKYAWAFLKIGDCFDGLFRLGISLEPSKKGLPFGEAH